MALTKIPERKVGSLGPAKSDLVPPPNAQNYIAAAEWNVAMDTLVDVCALALDLQKQIGKAGGDLNDTYKRGVKAPSAILLDAVRGGLFVRDDAAPVPGPLLAVSDAVDLRRYLHIAADRFALATATGLGIESDIAAGAVRLSRPGDPFLPASLGGNALGSLALPFSACYALQPATRPVLLAAGAGGEVVIDATQGSMQLVSYTGDVGQLSIVGGASGQIIAVILAQQGSTGGRFRGPLGAGLASIILSLDGAEGLPLTQSQDGITIFWFYSTGINLYIEMARWLQGDPEGGCDVYDLAAGPAAVEVRRFESRRTLCMFGKNPGPSYINLRREAMVPGVKYELDFGTGKGGAGGVQTSTAAPLEIRDNGTPLIRYDAARTLSGVMTATYDTRGWRLGDATLYS